MLRAVTRPLRGFLTVAAGGMLARASAFVMAVILARALGQSSFGDIAIFTALLTSFTTATDWIDVTYVRRASGAPSSDQEHLGPAVALKLLVVGGFVLAAYPLGWVIAELVLDRPDLTGAASLAVAGGVLLGLIMLQASRYQARERMPMFSALTSVYAVATLVLVGAFVLVDPSPSATTVYALSAAVSAVLALAAAATLVRAVRPLGRHVGGIPSILTYAKWLIATQVVLVALQRVDVLVLARFEDSATVGDYGVALRLVAIPAMFVAAAAGYLLPRVGRTRGSGIEMRRHVGEIGVLASVLVSGTALVWVLTPTLIDLLFGPAFDGAVVLSRILLVGVMFLSASALVTQFFLVQDSPRHVFWLILVKLGTMLVMTLLLVPSAGAVGAAVGATAAEAVALVYSIVVVRRASHWRTRPKESVAAADGRVG